MNKTWPLFAVLAACGCAEAPVRPESAFFWKPEVYIRAPEDAVRDSVVGSMVASGYHAEEANTVSLVFERPAQGPCPDDCGRHRVTFSFAPRWKETYVSARYERVRILAGGHRSLEDRTAAARDIQSFLDELKARLERVWAAAEAKREAAGQGTRPAERRTVLLETGRLQLRPRRSGALELLDGRAGGD